MSPPQVVESPHLATTGPAWSQATVAGGLVFVSGQVAWDEHGEVVGRGSVEQQTERVFLNVRHALEAAGSGIDGLARITVYLTDLGDLAGFRAVRDRWLDGIRPASTVVIVASLVDPDLLVEVDAVAAL